MSVVNTGEMVRQGPFSSLCSPQREWGRRGNEGTPSLNILIAYSLESHGVQSVML